MQEREVTAQFLPRGMSSGLVGPLLPLLTCLIKSPNFLPSPSHHHRSHNSARPSTSNPNFSHFSNASSSSSSHHILPYLFLLLNFHSHFPLFLRIPTFFWTSVTTPNWGCLSSLLPTFELLAVAASVFSHGIFVSNGCLLQTRVVSFACPWGAGVEAEEMEEDFVWD